MTKDESTAFGIVCAMEDDVIAVAGYAEILVLLALTADRDPSEQRALYRLAKDLRALHKRLEGQRGKLFRTLHPVEEMRRRKGETTAA